MKNNTVIPKIPTEIFMLFSCPAGVNQNRVPGSLALIDEVAWIHDFISII